MGRRDDRKSPRQKMQDAMSTSRGQTILNYAYNWGAAIVIMGALFKLVHFPGANFMLCLGMGTEVLIFFISAFDLSGVKRHNDHKEVAAPSSSGFMDAQFADNSEPVNAPLPGAFAPQQAQAQPQYAGQPYPQQPGYAPQPVAPQPQATAQPAPITPEMEQATIAYMEQLKAMTDMLSRCTAQAATISNDAVQMDALSKNLAGINAIYEMQLRSASTQITTIDQVHEQTRRMAQQIEELNSVYARMLQAMTASVK